MLLAGRRLEDITEEDLRQVVIGSTESESVDFKRDMWGTNDEAKREMLRDISALANHIGGEILVGVDEDDNGTATTIPGIPGEGHAERVTSSCRSNLDRPLQGLVAQPVALSNGNSALVIRIPYSLNGPHMITFGGLNQFWKRYGRTKGKMTVDEIEDAVSGRLNAEERAEQLVQSRIAALENSGSGQRWLFLAATPLFLHRAAINVLDDALMDLFSRPPALVRTPAGGSELHMHSSSVRPTLHGLRGESHDRQGQLRQFLELHRTGHLEVATNWIFSDDDGRYVYPSSVLEYSFNILGLAQRIWSVASFAGPAILSMCLLGVANTQLSIGSGTYEPQTPWAEETLQLPAIGVGDIATASIRPVVKSWNDVLWNAYGLRECLHLNSEGQLTTRSGLEMTPAAEGV